MFSRTSRSSLWTMTPSRVAVGEPLDVAPGHAVGDLLDGEIELVARDEIDGASGDEALFGLDRNLGADEADFDARIDRLDHLRRLARPI